MVETDAVVYVINRPRVRQIDDIVLHLKQFVNPLQCGEAFFERCGGVGYCLDRIDDLREQHQIGDEDLCGEAARKRTEPP